jgi:hypothetical protein
MCVLLDIAFVTQGVFPKAHLPECLHICAPTQTVHHALLDEHPAVRKIGIIRGQTPNGMQVIGHEHHG